jgi:hypothetical protein
MADDGISSNYNGLFTSVEHRFSQSYTILASARFMSASSAMAACYLISLAT